MPSPLAAGRRTEARQPMKPRRAGEPLIGLELTAPMEIEAGLTVVCVQRESVGSAPSRHHYPQLGSCF